MGSYMDDPSLNDTPREEINLKRNLAKVCQDDWEKIRPNEYFPNTLITGECWLCGNQTFVAQISREEYEKASTEPDPTDRYGRPLYLHQENL